MRTVTLTVWLVVLVGVLALAGHCSDSFAHLLPE